MLLSINDYVSITIAGTSLFDHKHVPRHER
jgi:hypothetical protein